MKNTRTYLGVALLSLALTVMGCNKMGSRSDSQIASDVQNKIFADSSVPDKQITINSNKGVVTLSGTVSSDAARSAAATDAAQVDGVKTLVKTLEVSSPPNVPPPQRTAAVQPPPVPAPEPTRATTTRVRQQRSTPRYADNSGNNGLRTTVPSSNAGTTSAGSYTPP